jgi:hypothetical protein
MGFLKLDRRVEPAMGSQAPCFFAFHISVAVPGKVKVNGRKKE